jgi:hypothetical protein
VGGDGVGAVAGAALEDGRAVGAVPAREVDRLLQHRRRLVRTAHAELCYDDDYSFPNIRSEMTKKECSLVSFTHLKLRE